MLRQIATVVRNQIDLAGLWAPSAGGRWEMLSRSPNGAYIWGARDAAQFHIRWAGSREGLGVLEITQVECRTCDEE